MEPLNSEKVLLEMSRADLSTMNDIEARSFLARISTVLEGLPHPVDKNSSSYLERLEFQLSELKDKVAGNPGLYAGSRSLLRPFFNLLESQSLHLSLRI